MDYRTITSLTLRIAGALILVDVVSSAPHTIEKFLYYGGRATSPGEALFLTALALVLPLAIGLALVYFPSLITNRIIRIDGQQAYDPGTAREISESLMPVAFACLGLYFVCAALYDGVYWLSRLKLYYALIDSRGLAPPAPALLPNDFAGIASTAVQFGLGLALLLGSKGISGLVVRLRS